jgi:hypothetical protein
MLHLAKVKIIVQRVSKLALALVVMATVSSQTASAQQAVSDVKLYVGANLANDSNLYRVEDEIQTPGGVDGRGLADTFFSVYAGIDSNWALTAKGAIRFDAEIIESIYDKYPETDNTSGNLLARYDYSGNATEFFGGYQRVEELVNFENQVTPRIDFRIRQRVFAGLRQKLGLNWSVGVGGGFTDINFDIATPVERTNAELDVTYESRKGSTFAIVYDYQKRENAGANALGFEESMLGPEVDWKISPALALNFTLKYQERLPEDPTLVEFDGPTGDIELQWTVSERVSFALQAFHRISSLGDQLSNFAIVDGQSLRGEWKTSEKLIFSLRVNHELRNFEEEPSLVPLPGQEIREDDLTMVIAGIAWKPRRTMTIDLSAEIGDRSSNRFLQDYSYETYTVGFKYEFL